VLLVLSQVLKLSLIPSPYSLQRRSLPLSQSLGCCNLLCSGNGRQLSANERQIRGTHTRLASQWHV